VASIVACDFFTVETNPTGEWVTQQARNLGLDFADAGIRFLIRDRDSKYSGPFDEDLRSKGIRIVRTPVRSPKANAVAERFVRTVRTECLDWLLLLNRRHLEHVLRVFVDHYNRQRPHRALDLRPPQPEEEPKRSLSAATHGRDRLGGLIHEPLPSRRMSCDTNIGALQPERPGDVEQADLMLDRGSGLFECGENRVETVEHRDARKPR
jgi:Integrase core domain